METVSSKLQSYMFGMIVWFCVFIWASVDGQIITGEPHSVPVNGTQVLAAARFAVAEFNGVNAEEQFVYRIMTITSAKIQVELTKKSRSKFQLSETNKWWYFSAGSRGNKLHPGRAAGPHRVQEKRR